MIRRREYIRAAWALRGVFGRPRMTPDPTATTINGATTP